jgi:hypothetical protein
VKKVNETELFKLNYLLVRSERVKAVVVGIHLLNCGPCGGCEVVEESCGGRCGDGC